MNTISEREYVDPYYSFTRHQWRALVDSPLIDFTENDVAHLFGVNEVVSLDEVLEVYSPLARLIRLHIEQAKKLHDVSAHFLSNDEPKMPFIIGVAGSVASGKSTTSRILRELLAYDGSLRVKVVGTDGFLLTNKQLQSCDMLDRKGFPESYDLVTLLRFLFDLKSGRTNLSVPIYSHHQYDILPETDEFVGDVDVLILEGLNILQTGASGVEQQRVFVSDFLDFSVFVDAEVEDLKQWYIHRVATFSKGPMCDDSAYFHFLSTWPEEDVVNFAQKVWTQVNEVNLKNNILPFRYRAQCVLHKEFNHKVNHILLRRL